MKTFNEVAKINDRDGILIVDSLNLCFRYKHSGKKKFKEDFLATVNSLARSYNCNKVILTSDAGSTYRKNIDSEYKANRKKLREEQTKEEAQEFQNFLEEVDNSLDFAALSHLVLKFQGVEADDIAAYIVKHFHDKSPNIWLISTDKDWDLLIKPNVSRFSYRSREETTYENWDKTHMYSIDEFISIKVIQGDKGDNVPGVAGIGEKRATELVSKYGSALNVYDAIPINDTKKYIQNLNEFKDKLLVNYELMDLLSYCEDALLGNDKEIYRLVEKHIGT